MSVISKEAGTVSGELPAVLAELENNTTLDIARINYAEQLYQKCAGLMQKLIYYQSFFQDDFNRLKNGTAALYSNIQDIKQKEYQRERDEIIETTHQVRKARAREKTKNIVRTLITLTVFAAVVLTISFFIYWKRKDVGQFLSGLAPAASPQPPQLETKNTGNPGMTRMRVTQDGSRMRWRKDTGRYERLALRSAPGSKKF